MDLLSLDIFRTVAQEHSVTRAAERLGRVQSNVTTRVQQLEEQLGTALFFREGKRMQLTPAGTTLLGYAERLLSLAEEARQAVSPEHPMGRLRLGAMESTSLVRLPQPLAQLHADWPDLRLELRTSPSRQLIEQLLAHEIDAALVAWPPPGMDADELSVDCTPIYEEALLLALPATHPQVASARDLELHTVAAFTRGCTYRQIGEDWMRAGGRQQPQVIELASYPAILACVAAGSCAGVVPQALLDQLRAPPALQWVPLQPCTTMLVTRQGFATPAFTALRNALLASANVRAESATASVS
ncbi:LysR substrate-binding domain-containing protein [Diaphorobacter aerolatus]|uniref:LysR family transcriptional regulator n=1 Tax=Diaphorobacter aerolatus TaxID=1288495 RepID=A0A7H0GFU1_9BURK|nr:LysR substrate-binding domain-containing protein [Diaphorobacter aerolatus]QNP47157.1 LysR family transcriptional regulator [Diaphorobacter aerolatus]